jgi:hypothetical protein
MRGGHCPVIAVHPSPPYPIQYTLFTSLIAGSHLTQCVPPRVRDCLVPGELDTSLRQGNGFKLLPTQLTYTHSPPFLSPSLFPFPNDAHGCALVSSSTLLHPEILLFFHPCPLLRNIESPPRLCVSHSTLLSFSSHLRMLS